MERELAVEKIRTIAELGPPLASSTPHRALIGGTGAMDFGEWAGRVWAEVGAPKSGGKKLFFALDFFLPSRLVVNIAKKQHTHLLFPNDNCQRVRDPNTKPQPCLSLS